MAEQLPLAPEPDAPTGRVRYTLMVDTRTKRHLAVEWSDGDPTGLAGPYDTPPAEADLPGQPYSRHPSVVRHLRQDIAARRYHQYEYDPEPAA